MNIHIFHDDKFTNGAIEQFEKFYPDQNIYIVLLYNSTTLQFTNPNPKIITFHIRDRSIIKSLGQIISTNNATNLFVHYLDTYKASITLKVLNQHPLKFYWIFYGGDLYDYLSRYHQYDILDNKSFQKNTFKEDLIKNIKYLLWFGWTTKYALKKAFERLDYFCFWNEYDFDLFHSKVKSNAKHKNFIYYNALGNPDFPMVQKKNKLMINHSASPSGNHHYIIDEIRALKLKESNYSILLPLSYGDKFYADTIVEKAKSTMTCEIEALRNFMPLSEYQTLLAEVKIAIFGMKRQEAAGNIFQLLNMGAKVFLRKENTLFHWLKKRDFIVFSLEDDFSELQQLEELSSQQIEHNRDAYKKTFNDSVYKEMMDQLVDKN